MDQGNRENGKEKDLENLLYLKNLINFSLLSSAKPKGKMFNLVTRTWNPVTGCEHHCVYCWARELTLKKLRYVKPKRYKNGFKPSFHKYELRRKFGGNEFIFVSDMGDLFGEFIPDEWIFEVITHIKKFKTSLFLFLTKNPKRYFSFLNEFPENVILGATIETDLDKNYREISKAPLPSTRLKALKELDWPLKFISIEPVLEFSETFAEKIAEISPLVVYIGYDNYNHKLPEPPLHKTLALIKKLEEKGITTFKKTLRRSWNEKTK